MTEQELYLLEAVFETVKKSVSDDLESVQFKIETSNSEIDYSISIKDYLCGLQRYGLIDSFDSDCEKVKIHLPSPRNYEGAKDEMAGGTMTEDSIDVITDSFAEYGSMILKWFLRRKSRRKVF